MISIFTSYLIMNFIIDSFMIFLVFLGKFILFLIILQYNIILNEKILLAIEHRNFLLKLILVIIIQTHIQFKKFQQYILHKFFIDIDIYANSFFKNLFFFIILEYFFYMFKKRLYITQV